MKFLLVFRGIVSIGVISLFLIACESSEDTVAKPEKKKNKAHYVETYLTKQVTAGLSRERTGSLRYRTVVKIYNQEEGRIVDFPFFEGDQVKKGEIVAKLDDALLQAQLRRAKASRLKAESDLKRVQGLQQQNFSSEEDLARVSTELAVARADEELLQTRLSHTEVKAPFSGIVTERLSETGNVAERYTHLLSIADPSSLITEVSVSELLFNKLEENNLVNVRIDALGKKTFEGRISRIHPTLDPLTRHGTIEVEIEPAPKDAKSGQLCRVEIKTKASERLVIPFSALRRDQEGEFVFAVDDESKVKRVAVRTGPRLDEFVEVLEGLTEGENIVSKGFLGLKENKKVKIVKPKVEEKV